MVKQGLLLYNKLCFVETQRGVLPMAKLEQRRYNTVMACSKRGL